jgi:hypothetical protein
MASNPASEKALDNLYLSEGTFNSLILATTPARGPSASMTVGVNPEAERVRYHGAGSDADLDRADFMWALDSPAKPKTYGSNEE